MLPIGETIYLWREARGLTQAELSRKSGLSRPNLSVIEQGGRDLTVGTLRRLAEALEVEPGTLADGVPPGETPRPRLGRRNLDRIARWLVQGKGVRPPLSKMEREAVRVLSSLVKRKVGVGLNRARALPRTSRQERRDYLMAQLKFGRPEVENLFRRIEKLSSLSSHE